MKRIISAIMVAVMLCGCLLCTSCNNAVESKNSFTFWLGSGASSQYYTKYEDNPIMQYIMKYKTFDTKDGDKEKIDFKFTVPIQGQEMDSFNSLLSTNTYTDIIDTTYGTELLADMYKEGKLLDLKEYIDNYMPNYKAFMEAHPELTPYFTTTVDGEEKYLEIWGFSDVLDIYEQFCGYCYRRDWIIKYGKQPDQLWSLDDNNKKVYQSNPNAGKAFSGYYSLDKDGNTIHSVEFTDKVNSDSWTDDVVFPSGNTDPIYISDWEWMLGIFKRAIDDQSISDGYVMSLWYPGFIPNGELSNAFGGSGSFFYLDPQTKKVGFAGVEEGFKVYMQTMNKWYKNGWIDPRFNEKSSDVFYMVDETLLYQGKVGLWMGTGSNLGGRIYNERQPLTSGIMVAGAANPINDLYGSDAVKFKEPFVMFQNDISKGSIAITDKAKDKDLVQLVSFFDYLYSDEGSLLKTMGLNKEQYKESQDTIYKKYNLTEGAYTITSEGKYEYTTALEEDNANIRGAMTLGRIPGITLTSHIVYNYTPTYVHWREQWLKYKATGYMGGVYTRRSDPAKAKEGSKINTALAAEYMYIEVPKFVIGTYNFESDYNNFLTSLKKRNYERGIVLAQETADIVANITK